MSIIYDECIGSDCMKGFSDVNQLLNWNPCSEYIACISRKKFDLQRIQNQDTQSSNRAQLLVCHDYRGGYIPCESSVNGLYNNENIENSIRNHLNNAWNFKFWYLVDIFVYFSHWTISPPPRGFTEAGHTHHTKVLGTIIFEWDSGAVELRKVLKNPALVIDKLVQIAVFLGFDGYLLNVECELNGSTEATKLLEFTRLLTHALHRSIPHSKLIWYDSVTADNGQLQWQNGITTRNYPFFSVSDGIFLNYGWNPNALRKCVALKVPKSRRFDVFAGIDAFGRGTYGGGGFSSWEGIRAAREAGCSAALFAPGWTVENSVDCVDAAHRERLVWSTISRMVLPRQCITSIPFESNFDPGFYPSLYYDLTKTNLQPIHFRNVLVASEDCILSQIFEVSWNSFSETDHPLKHGLCPRGFLVIRWELNASRFSTASFCVSRLFSCDAYVNLRGNKMNQHRNALDFEFAFGKGVQNTNGISIGILMELLVDEKNKTKKHEVVLFVFAGESKRKVADDDESQSNECIYLWGRWIRCVYAKQKIGESLDGFSMADMEWKLQKYEDFLGNAYECVRVVEILLLLGNCCRSIMDLDRKEYHKSKSNISSIFSPFQPERIHQNSNTKSKSDKLASSFSDSTGKNTFALGFIKISSR